MRVGLQLSQEVQKVLPIFITLVTGGLLENTIKHLVVRTILAIVALVSVVRAPKRLVEIP
jgi:hypothetical protein